MKGAIFTLSALFFIVRAAADKDSKVQGGRPADRKFRLPAVLLRIATKGGDERNCTGSVVGRRFIISSASCFDKPGPSTDDDVRVRSSYAYVGEFRAEVPLTATNYSFSKVHIHKRYRPSRFNFRYDVAVVELSSDIERKAYKPVRIAESPGAGAVGVAVGYGAVDRLGTPATYVGQTYMQLLKFSVCKRRESRPVRRRVNEALQFCAGSVQFPRLDVTDVCDGDEGGPLYLNNRGRRAVQFGIVSFSSTQCGRRGGTVWLTRLSPFSENIKTIVNEGSDNDFRDVVL